MYLIEKEYDATPKGNKSADKAFGQLDDEQVETIAQIMTSDPDVNAQRIINENGEKRVPELTKLNVPVDNLEI